MLTAHLLLALTLAPADAPAPPDAPPPPDAVSVADAGELQGEWEVVACVYGGRNTTASFRGDRWVFVGASFRIVSRVGPASGPSTIRVDAAHEPPEVDDVTQDGKIGQGIYRRTRDELVWSAGEKGQPRPSSFQPAAGVFLWKLRRVKK
jgi:uncharacterized protein (TIGR03067 family)